MKQRKNAFTLIELLAVIVILAIIALIATPIIINIIEKAKKSAFMDTAYGLIEAAKLEYTQGILTNQSSEKLYMFPQSETGKLEFSGSEPSGGSLKITETGKVSLAIHDGTWCVTKGANDAEVNISKYQEDTCIREKIPTPEKCFQVEDHEDIAYTVNQETCVTYKINEDYYEEEEAQKYCLGEWVQGESLNSDIDLENVTIEELEIAGVITVNSRNVDGITITKYNKSDNDCGAEVVIPDTIGGKLVKKIGEAAFIENWNGDWDDWRNEPTIEDSKKIISVTFPKELEVIGKTAFSNYYDDVIFNQITELDFSEATKLRTIGGYAFYYNPLTRLDLSGLTNLTTIGFESFAFNKITSVNMNNLSNLAVIGFESFLDNKLTSIDFSNLTNLSSIHTNAFGWNLLTDVNLSNLPNLESIGDSAFTKNQLTTLKLNNLPKLYKIYDWAFKSNQLTNVEFSNLPNLTTIGADAFQDNQLTTIDLSNLTGLITMEYGAFSYNQLTSIDLSKLTNLTTIEPEVFYRNQLTSIVIPSNVIMIGGSAFNNNLLPEDQAIIYARNSDGSENKTVIVSYGGTNPNQIIPETVVEIEQKAFSYSKLTSVDFSKATQLTTIRDYAFSSNNLTSVTIPASVTTIGGRAFSSNKLTSVTIEGKSSKSDFVSYPSGSYYSPWGWATGYKDSNIKWNG